MRTHFAEHKCDPLDRLSQTEGIVIYCEMRDLFRDSAEFSYVPVPVLPFNRAFSIGLEKTPSKRTKNASECECYRFGHIKQ